MTTLNQSETESNVTERKPPFTRRVWITAIIVAAVFVALFIIWHALEVLLALFAGLLLAVFLNGVSRFVANHTPVPRKLALFLLLALIVLALVLLGLYAAPQVDAQLNQFGTQFGDSWNSLKSQLQKTTFGTMLLSSLPGAGDTGSGAGLTTGLFSRVGNVFSSTFNAVTKVLLILFVGIYVAYEPSFYVNGVVKLVPQEYRKHVRHLIAEIVFTLERWLVSQFIAMVIIGVLATIGLMFIGIPMALLLGLLAGLLEFIPILGPLVASALPIIIALSMSTQTALYVVLLFIVIQSLEGYVITPVVHKEMVRLPPALLFTTQILLGLFAGIFGVLVAAPLTVTAIVAVKLLYVEDILHDHTVDYLSESEDEQEHEKERRQQQDASASIAP